MSPSTGAMQFAIESYRRPNSSNVESYSECNILVYFLTQSFSFFFLITAPTSTELGVSVKIDVGEGEPVESALRRFKREVNKSGHLMELRHRRYFENSQEKKKRKVKEARMRKRLERMQRRRMNNRT